MTGSGKLPVDDVVEDVKAALAAGRPAVLVAPPGAGKTTGVAPALLDADWLAGKRILILEPRRIAARAAAERMASLRGERVGETIGLRARLDTRVGPGTRIEVVTEGVFTRTILDDPALDGIGLVIFDEFHERSLDADLGLALALDARAGLRDDLRLLVMSATLDGARVASLLGDAPVITSNGRAFPVETRYVGRPADHTRIAEAVAATVLRALAEETGSILAFLPGQSEINRTASRLAEQTRDATVDIVALHGGLDARAQRSAIQPAPTGRRKIVLATAIAQTSITIEGVRLVVDSGLERVPRFDADAGLTRLETVRVSRATADQRRGRAGRTEPGIAYRLWSEAETQGLVAFTTPEILSADLCALLLDCAAWGVTAPATLAWLDPPPPGGVAAARSGLEALGAIDGDGRLTSLGRDLRALPLAPPLAAMVLAASRLGAGHEAALIAAILSERGAGGTSPDIDDRLQSLRRDRNPRSEALRNLATDWGRRATALAGRPATGATLPSPPTSTAALLALGFPDRIGKARGPRGTFLLANGRAGLVDPASRLAGAEFIVAAELTGRAAGARITLAASLDAADLATVAGARITTIAETVFDPATAALRSRSQRRLSAIVLASEPRAVAPGPAAAALLAEGLARLGLDRLPWTPAQRQLRHRAAFVAAARTADNGPQSIDLSDEALASTVTTWLAPFIGHATRLGDIDAGHIAQALDALLPWTLRQQLDSQAPTHFVAPTGNRHTIDYESEGAPVVSLRVQELYGLKTHPAIAGGRLPLTLQLLSPASRPIQITRDLPGFWAGSWRDVKSEMKGRYPRHLWPDDPANAQPTSRAKPRGT